MSRLVFTREMLARLRADLFRDDRECCAVLFGRAIERDGRLVRLVADSADIPPHEAYLERTAVSAVLRPEYVATLAQRARRTGESLVFVHTHPFPLNEFSKIDDAGEAALASFLHQRLPGTYHAALLITPEQFIARGLGSNTELAAAAMAETIQWGRPPQGALEDTFYDRQVRAFGKAGQQTIAGLRIAVVGLGGTGTVVLESLAHLGARDVLLIDPDVIEDTNLNRLVGATPADVGYSKVDVAAAWARKINPKLAISSFRESVLQDKTAQRLVDTDFVFCCTDSHGSRAVLNQLAYQYLLPTIDMGTVIATDQQKITHIAGRTQLFAPGLACLVCGNFLDYEEVRRDLLSDFERKADPYIIGDREPAPAVISLNETIASLAVTMFLNTAVGVPGTSRHLNYNAISGVCRPAHCAPHPSCVVCSPSGALAKANLWPLPTRND